MIIFAATCTDGWCLVDGGHRAIKYSRVGGVQKEIYSEGISISLAIVDTDLPDTSADLNPPN